jgi:hypothetical protein
MGKNFEINGHEYSFTSIRCSAGKLTGDMISSISYSDGLDPGKVVGGDGIPIGMTRGTYEADASLEFHTRRIFQQWFESLGQYPYEVYFDISVAYAETGISPVIQDTIPRVRLKKASIDASKGGNDPIAVPVELAVGGVILWNGRPGASQRQD